MFGLLIISLNFGNGRYSRIAPMCSINSPLSRRSTSAGSSELMNEMARPFHISLLPSDASIRPTMSWIKLSALPTAKGL